MEMDKNILGKGKSINQKLGVKKIMECLESWMESRLVHTAQRER